ncbi:MAG: hypothetical protein HYX55_06055 [Chloroflexi bacterium]|nr:hypothetical protein [Chloroflexota bacterium]
MRTLKRRFILMVASAALVVAALPGSALAATELNVCTWLAQPVGDAVGNTSAAPGAVLGPNNGGQPGGDKGPFTISFTTSGALQTTTSSSSGCS